VTAILREGRCDPGSGMAPSPMARPGGLPGLLPRLFPREAGQSARPESGHVCREAQKKPEEETLEKE
jgi:hypothetical protein